MTQVLPILFIFLSGYIFKRFHKDSSTALIDIVVYFIFPVFIIYKIHFLEFNEDIYVVVGLAFAAFFIGITFAYIFSRIFNINANSAAMIAMSVAYGNTSFLGFAFVDSLYGDYALSLAIFYDQVNMFVLAFFSPIICSLGSRDQKFSIKKVLKSIATFPPTIAFVIAILTKGMVFPEILTLYLKDISMILVPVVMFAVGMKFNISSLKGQGLGVSIIILISMVLVPLSIYLIGTTFWELDIAIKSAVMEAAMPPMVMATMIAIRGGLDEDLGMASLGVGMTLSFISIPLLFSLLG
jgi:predicted permease